MHIISSVSRQSRNHYPDGGYLRPLCIEYNHSILSAVARRIPPCGKLKVIMPTLPKLIQTRGYPPSVVRPIRLDSIANHTASVSGLSNDRLLGREMELGRGDAWIAVVVFVVCDSVQPEFGSSTRIIHRNPDIT